ncbi:hypothetical protein NOR_03874 [Metarhizium rileyi]|nr:hypothetical protein NOR_03874 [Metarhizium rileyi RCEF 4871]
MLSKLLLAAVVLATQALGAVLVQQGEPITTLPDLAKEENQTGHAVTFTQATAAVTCLLSDTASSMANVAPTTSVWVRRQLFKVAAHVVLAPLETLFSNQLSMILLWLLSFKDHTWLLQM